VFWKDKERRFVGVNQAFLDFYGFDSADVLIGKTDEDMGWHSDPIPFMQDELRVLNGESTYKVQGKCIIRGEERDIIASKRPIYEDGEIVGLVGSFSDITDVVRRMNEREKAQVMYSVEQLREYAYFDKLLDQVNLYEILDPLTGIVSRAYILDFAKSLIASGTPFTFTIVDLDNFKYINDTYGHSSGDVVLMDVAKGLAGFLEKFGVVGRFGGDELLLINLRDVTYDQKKQFFKDIYETENILRKNIKFQGNSLYITGTSGCATYPDDASTFDGLFGIIDKALYRGKEKGRNCFIIYVEDKYKDLEVKNMGRHGVFTIMHRMTMQLEKTDDPEEKLHAVMPLLKEELHITDLYYIDSTGLMKSVLDEEVEEQVEGLSELMVKDMYIDSTLDKLEKLCPSIYKVFNSRKVQAILIVRVGMGDETYGYLVCAEPRSQRIWQEDECGIMYFLARHLAAHRHFSG
jgi:diguanylate cyclase (GGDEF)-like protein/PAS domain S-box-containing protein